MLSLGGHLPSLPAQVCFDFAYAESQVTLAQLGINIHHHSSAAQWTQDADGGRRVGSVHLARKDLELHEDVSAQRPGSCQKLCVAR